VFDQSWQEQLTKWLPNKMDKLINWSLISGTKNKGISQWSKMMTFYQRKEQEYKWTSGMLCLTPTLAIFQLYRGVHMHSIKTT
jgi:hypothetical protein